MNQVVTDGGNKCGITNLSADGNQIYGGGFAFGCGNFEGTFAADGSTGAINWVNDCHGDTYDIYPVGQVLYSVGHAHNCSFIGGFPNSSPTWSVNMRHALAFTTHPTGTNAGRTTTAGTTPACPTPSLLQLVPDDRPSAATPARARRPGRSPATATTSSWAASSRRSTAWPSRAWSGSR